MWQGALPRVSKAVPIDNENETRTTKHDEIVDIFPEKEHNQYY